MAVLNLPKFWTATKQIVSACSPGMNDPIMHLMGFTPESPTLEDAFKGNMPKNVERYKVTMDDIVEMYHHINNIAPAPGRTRRNRWTSSSSAVRSRRLKRSAKSPGC